MTSRLASCACGQLQIRCPRQPDIVSLCHCLDCQRRTGSPFGVAAFFDVATTEIIGSSRTFQRDSDSGFPIAFHFCGTCGSTVFWYPSRRPAAIAVAVGCFADPSFPTPTRSVYDKRQHGWVAMQA